MNSNATIRYTAFLPIQGLAQLDDIIYSGKTER